MFVFDERVVNDTWWYIAVYVSIKFLFLAAAG